MNPHISLLFRSLSLVAHPFTHTPTASSYIHPRIILKQSPELPISLRILDEEFLLLAGLQWATGLLKSQALGAAGWGLGNQRSVGNSFDDPSMAGK